MDIGLIGTGPAVDAVAAAFSDVDVGTERAAPERLGTFDFAVVVGTVGADAFLAATEACDRWAAVEVGGVGGRPTDDLDAAVSLFGPQTGCYRCLRRRVEAARDDEVDAADDPEATGVRSAVRYAGALAGRRVVRHLSGDDLAGTVAEVPGGERRFLPVPGCRCGDGRDRTLALAHREVELTDALDRMERAVDDRLGIVTEVGERESFPAPYYLGATADTTGFSDARAAPFAAGTAADWNAAYVKAVGEGLERYAAGVYRGDEFVTAAATGLDGAVAPGLFVAPEGYDRPAADAETDWVPALDLAADEPAWLPAAVVHHPPSTERVRPPITTGLGLGNSTVEAVLSGLYEVVERDAAMLSWYSTAEPLGLAVDDEAFATLEKRARAEELSVSTLLLTQDVDVPVVACAVHRDGEWPRFAAGSGADLDVAAAATDALAEALQNWMELRGMGPETAAEQGGEIGRYAEFPEPARSFVDPETTVPAASVGGDQLPTGEAELDAVVERVADGGLTPYASRLTTRDLAALGFEAVRVVVPTAQPLFQADPYFGERLGRVARSMGFEPATDRPYHPFP
ncbi:MAG: YcaO-like family protein [Halolamina sp.]